MNYARMNFFNKFRPASIVVLITVFTFAFSENYYTSPFKLHIGLVSIIVFMTMLFFAKRKYQTAFKSELFVYSLVFCVISIVAATGWFLSPFFFSLYLLGIFLGFTFSPLTSFSLIGILVALFSVNIGVVDLTYDYLTVLSLLLTIPLTIYLRREFLRLKESEKQILILEKEKEMYKSSIDKVLANKIKNLAVNLRQPINDIRLLAFSSTKDTNASISQKNKERITTCIDEAIQLIDRFEEENTGEKLLVKKINF